MKYDFDRIIDRRGTNSSKWDLNKTMFGTEDVLDMWVADMDFECPEPVLRAIRERLEHPILGYTFPPQSLYEAIVDRMERFYGWKIQKEWIVFNSGVVNGLFSAVDAFCRPGDELILQPPVYYPFYRTSKNLGVVPLENRLKFDGKRYTMDFDALEKMFEAHTTFPVHLPRIKMLVLCSPHNPVGRVWTKEELKTLSEICLKNDCIVVSDEIHCDLMLYGSRHTVTSTLSEEIQHNTITLMAASKTFNLAGLGTSFAVIPDPEKRKAYALVRGGHSSGNLFGHIALEAAFEHGDEYLSQLCEYLTGNMEYFCSYIEKNIPKLKIVRPEGTYLAWLDMRELGLSNKELQHFVRFKARLALDDGYAFGPGGDGFQRVNLACPRSTVEEALARLEAAVNSL